MLLAVVLMAGCGKKDNSEERKLPTLAPEVTDLVQKGAGQTMSSTNWSRSTNNI